MMKSPIGDSTFTDEFATKKVAKTADVLQRIAKLPTHTCCIVPLETPRRSLELSVPHNPP
jgi:hypothetical protein